MIKNILKVSFILFFVLLFCMVIAIVGMPNALCASAIDTLTVKQAKTVYYAGNNFLMPNGTFRPFGEEGNNLLYEALEFTFGENDVTVPSSDIVVSISEIIEADSYKCVITAKYDGEEYNIDTTLTVSKKPLYVRAKINGETVCTLNEGEKYYTSIEYDGFVDGENVSDLLAPAIIQTEPKMPTTGYLIVPELAQSKNYEIIYEGAKIIINSNPDSIRTVKDGEEDILILRGSFSPYYQIEYYDAGLNKADPKYAAINEKIEVNFNGNRLFEGYDQANAYIINMTLDGQTVQLTDPVNVRIKIPEKLMGKNYYRVIHFANDGSYEFLSATEVSGGYISFTTTDLGEFVLLTPVQGVNKVTIIAICAGIVGVVVLGVLLGFIFKRKY